MPWMDLQDMFALLSSWWLNQPIWKLWSSNWIISPRFGVKVPKIFELPQPRYTLPKSGIFRFTPLVWPAKLRNGLDPKTEPNKKRKDGRNQPLFSAAGQGVQLVWMNRFFITNSNFKDEQIPGNFSHTIHVWYILPIISHKNQLNGR